MSASPGSSGLSGERDIRLTKFERLTSLVSGKRYRSLNLKLAVVIFIAAVLTVGAFFAFSALEKAGANRLYLSEAAKERAVDGKYAELQAYIRKNHVMGTDTMALQEWIDEEDYTQLIIYDEDRDYFNAGWVTGGKGEEIIVENREDMAAGNDSGEDVTAWSFISDLNNRIVKFEDRKYYVYLNVYDEERWYRIMDIVNIVLSAFVFIATILLYNQSVLQRMIGISEEVRVIREGNFQHRITSPYRDELADLCNSVDTMRGAILEKMDAEKAAQDANAQLITAMSHDIRTPLTSLIGYLDIIEGRKYSSEEELDRYIHSCRDKAFQLKDLSDKLFSYFLVYSGKGPERELEIIDAGILFQQLLVEHVAEGISYGLRFNLQIDIPEGHLIEADISTLRRLFDNLFSNMMKYADPAITVDIQGGIEGSRVRFFFSNHVRENQKRVESSRIGVKTCRKICEDMHGVFRAKELDGFYSTEILLPLADGQAEAE